MENETWIGPWCSRHALVVRDKAIIIDETHEYRRHVYQNGQFKTEKIRIEKWWEWGYRYEHLPKGLI